MWIIPELSSWRVGRRWGRGIPSLRGMHGCTVLPPVGCKAHLGASLATAVAAALRKGGSMTQRDFA